METMKYTGLIFLSVVILPFLVTSAFAAAQNVTPSQAPLTSTQPGIIAVIGAVATVLFFVLLYKMKERNSQNHLT